MVQAVGMDEELRMNLRANSALTNVNSIIAVYLKNANRWKELLHRRRWVPMALQKAEFRLGRVNGAEALRRNGLH